jgi:hypothetical protein
MVYKISEINELSRRSSESVETEESVFDMGPQSKSMSSTSLNQRLSKSAVANSVFGLAFRKSGSEIGKERDDGIFVEEKDDDEDYNNTMALSLADHLRNSAQGLSGPQQREMREIVGLPDAFLPDRSHIGSLDKASRVGTGRRAHSNVLDLSHVAKRQEVCDSAHVNLLTSVLHCLERRNTTQSINLWGDLMSAVY